MLTVSVLTGDDTWENINTIYPRVLPQSSYVSLKNAFDDGRLTLKIEWENEILVDHLPYYFLSNETIEMNDIPLINAMHSVNGDVTGMISDDDLQDITLIPGEYIDLQFGPMSQADNTALVFESFGRYEKLADDESLHPDGFTLEQNYPNPFNPSTDIAFSLPVSEHVKLSIYNVLGQHVITLTDEIYEAGQHTIQWDGCGADGNVLASGIYFARIKTESFSAEKKMIFMK